MSRSLFQNVVFANPPPSGGLGEWLAQNVGSVRMADSTDAVSQICAWQPDLVIVERDMPAPTHGTELCRRLKLDPATNRIPVLMVVANEQRRASVLEVEIEANTYIAAASSGEMIDQRLQELSQWCESLKQADIEGEVKFLVQSHPSCIDPFCRLFRSLWYLSYLSTRKAKHLGLAVREMCMNAIEWGHRNQGDHPVHVLCQLDQQRIRIVIRDSGPGFNPLQLPHAADRNDPTRHMDIRENQGLREGGFGIMMSRSLVDELNYNDTGNEVELIKYVDRTP